MTYTELIFELSKLAIQQLKTKVIVEVKDDVYIVGSLQLNEKNEPILVVEQNDNESY